MANLCRYLIAAFLLVSSGAFAAVEVPRYHGKIGSWESPGKTSKSAACRAVFEIETAYTFLAAGSGESSGSCLGTQGTQNFQVGSWIRRFITCEHGSTDGVTCDEPPPPPPEDCAAGGPGIFSKSGPLINSNGSNYVVTSGGGSVCYGQCSHTLADRPASCYATAEGSTSGFCNYIGTPTGETCSEPDAPLGSTGSPLNPADTPNVPPSDPNDPGCPDGYGWSGTTCSKLPPPDGGDTGGGDTGGDTGGGDTGGGDTGGGGGGDSGGGDTGGGDTGGDTGGGDTGGGDEGGGEIGDGTGGGTGGGTGDGEGDDGLGGDHSSGVGNCSDERCSFSEDTKGYVTATASVADISDPEGPFYEGKFFDGLSKNFNASPLGKSISELKFPDEQGVCPTGTLDIFNERIEFNTHCHLYDSVRGILSSIFLALWGLAAVRILLSA